MLVAERSDAVGRMTQLKDENATLRKALRESEDRVEGTVYRNAW